jgi:tetratricopeptide (TPR) repeat protein
MQSASKFSRYQPVSSRLRLILLFLGMVTILGTGIWISPRVQGLYHQTRGGQLLERVFSTNDNLHDDIACERSPLTEEGARVQVDSAISRLHIAIEYNPNNAQSHLLLGRAYCLLGDPDKAITEYLVFIHLRPDNPLGHLELGFAYELAGDQSQAIQEWQEIQSIAQDFLSNGDLAFQHKHFDEAIDWYTRATMVEPNYVSAWVGLGKTYVELTEWETALESFQIAWEKEPEYSAIPLTQTLIRLEDFQAAEKILRQALTDYPESINRLQWWQLLGSSLTSRNDLEEASRVYEEALKEYPSNSELHLSLGWVYYNHRGDIELAWSEFQEAIDSGDTSGTAYFAIGQLLTREKKFSESDKWFRKAIEMNSDNRGWYLVRADAARSAKNLDLAINVLQELLNLDSKFSPAYYELAWNYHLKNQDLRASEAIEEALALASTPKAWYFVRAGLIYERMEENEKASAAYLRALEIDPQQDAAIQGLERLGDR